MKEIITLAELISSGDIEGGRYSVPYVQINAPEENELTLTLDELQGDRDRPLEPAGAYQEGPGR